MSFFRFLPPEKPTWKIHAALWNGAGWSHTYGGDCTLAQKHKTTGSKKEFEIGLHQATLHDHSKCTNLIGINVICTFTTSIICLPNQRANMTHIWFRKKIRACDFCTWKVKQTKSNTHTKLISSLHIYRTLCYKQGTPGILAHFLPKGRHNGS